MDLLMTDTLTCVKVYSWVAEEQLYCFLTDG